jgi:hypothetical protein
MANNYNFYANESSVDKDDRVEGRELEKLYDKCQQTNIQTTTQMFNDSKNDDSSLRADEKKGGPYTTVTKKYNYRVKKIEVIDVIMRMIQMIIDVHIISIIEYMLIEQ